MDACQVASSKRPYFDKLLSTKFYKPTEAKPPD